jgi:hypothetical protein
MLFNRQISFYCELLISVLAGSFPWKAQGRSVQILAFLSDFRLSLTAALLALDGKPKVEEGAETLQRVVRHRQQRRLQKERARGIGASSARGESDVRLSCRAIFTKVNRVI